VIYNTTLLPSIFHVEAGAAEVVSQILDTHAISTSRTLILTGRSHSKAVATAVAKTLSGAEMWIVESHSEAEVARIGAALEAAKSTLMIAIGGGGVIDVCKRASKLFGLPCLVIPTVVSNDGLMSPISVLKTSIGRFESLPSAMPLGVIADLDIIMAAPPKYLRASGGDLLSNLSATTDWRHVVNRGDGPKMNDSAFHLSRNSAESLVHWSNCDLSNPVFVRNLIVAQINSGMAMTIAGTSRPCSGPEHLVSHALDELDLTPDVLHGVQVGSICLFMLYLFGELSAEVLRFANAMELPGLWTDLSPDLEDRLPEILERTRQVRPERRTLLDEMSDMEIMEQLEAFAGRPRPRLRAI
jgi:glycerol-1-phosphate dehydrogenase [NAD(P)+]